MEKSIGLMLLLQLVLIAFNAVFACAEIAVISMNDNKLAKLAEAGDKRAIRLARLTNQPARFLATIPVSYTHLAAPPVDALSADQNLPRLACQKLTHQPEDRGLAAAGRPDHRNEFSFFNLKRQAVDNIEILAVVLENNLLKFQHRSHLSVPSHVPEHRLIARAGDKDVRQARLALFRIPCGKLFHQRGQPLVFLRVAFARIAPHPLDVYKRQRSTSPPYC